VKPGGIAILVFFGVAIAAFFAIAAGWIAYADYTNYFDREGSTGMAVVFMIAPLGGFAIGMICAVTTFQLLKRRLAA
jgi:hypothetical protein